MVRYINQLFVLFLRMQARDELIFVYVFLGSLPPSPADSGVSDVDPPSSHNSDDENRLHRHRHAMGKLFYLRATSNRE